MQDFQLNREDCRAAYDGAPAAEAPPAQLEAELDALICELEAAPAGSPSLDARIHYGLRVMAGRGEDIPALLIREGISWPTVNAVLDDTIPHYTTSLDAALDGERITFVLRSAKRGRWCAMQKAAGAEVIGWAASEALARRLVALKAWRAELAAADRAGPSPPGVSVSASQDGFRYAGAAADASDGESFETTQPMGRERSRDAKDWEILF